MLKKFKKRKDYFKLSTLGELHRISDVELGFENNRGHTVWLVSQSCSEISHNSRNRVWIIVVRGKGFSKPGVGACSWRAGPVIYSHSTVFSAPGHHHYTVPKRRTQTQIHTASQHSITFQHSFTRSGFIPGKLDYRISSILKYFLVFQVHLSVYYSL